MWVQVPPAPQIIPIVSLILTSNFVIIKVIVKDLSFLLESINNYSLEFNRDMVFNGSMHGLGPCRVSSSLAIPTNNGDAW